jgi:xylan 1,4-beta-xylosidase
LPLGGATASGGVWAPTLRHHAGIFYLTTTNVTQGGNFIVTASAPEGPWSEPIYVAQPGIDPSLFFDEDGSVLYTTAHDGAFQSRIDVRTGQLLGEPQRVWSGTGGQYPEGPHLYRRGAYYYLLLSEGGTEYGHMITLSRSRSPWGPFEPCPRNPLLSHRSRQSPIQGLGHADLVESASGEWFAVALGFRPNGYPPCYHLGRETFLCPVSWADDGFPVFADHGQLALEEETTLELRPFAAASQRDDFDTSELPLHYNYLRNPEPSSYSLTERPGYLRLRGAEAGLSDVASPTWVGRRQCHFAVRVMVRLEFVARAENEEAGLCVRMNEQHHYEQFLTRRNGRACVVLRRRIGSLCAEVACEPLTSKAPSCVLVIDAQRDEYVFSQGEDESQLRVLGAAETRYLSTEVAGGFTGVYFGMYATGNDAACAEPADFDWLEYRVATADDV